jgi:hypothetical protein
MDWFVIFLVAGAAIALWRIVYQVRKLGQRNEDDWDARLIERIRRSGIDPFKPMEVDFFLALPGEAVAREVADELGREGFEVDVKSVSDSNEHPFSVHAMKRMQLSLDGVRGVSTRLRSIATARGGRYDGWAAAPSRSS